MSKLGIMKHRVCATTVWASQQVYLNKVITCNKVILSFSQTFLEECFSLAQLLPR